MSSTSDLRFKVAAKLPNMSSRIIDRYFSEKDRLVTGSPNGFFNPNLIEGISKVNVAALYKAETAVLYPPAESAKHYVSRFIMRK